MLLDDAAHLFAYTFLEGLRGFGWACDCITWVGGGGWAPKSDYQFGDISRGIAKESERCLNDADRLYWAEVMTLCTHSSALYSSLAQFG